MSIALAGLYALVTTSVESPPDFKVRLTRYTAKLLLARAALIPAGGMNNY